MRAAFVERDAANDLPLRELRVLAAGDVESEHTRVHAIAGREIQRLTVRSPCKRAGRVVEAGAHVAGALTRDVVELEVRVQDLAERHAVRHHRVRLFHRRQRERTAIGRPLRRRLHVGTGVDPLGRARRRVDDERVAALVAEQCRGRRHVGDSPAVRRPVGRAADGELGRVNELRLLLCRDVDHPDVREAIITLVDLRIVLPLPRRVGGLGQRIDAQEGDALTVRRPAEAGNAFLRVRDLLGLAAIEMEDVDFGSRLLFASGGTARREECDRGSIGRPLRLRFTALAEGDLSRRSRAIDRNNPEMRADVVLVAEGRVTLDGVRARVLPGTEGIDDERAIRRDGGAADVLERHHVVDRHRALGRLGDGIVCDRRSGECNERQCDGQGTASA